MASYTSVKQLFTAICDAIRYKDGSSELIPHQEIPARIEAIPQEGGGGGGGELEPFLRHDDALRYLIMTPSDGYEVTFSVTVRDGDSGTIAWGDGSEEPLEEGTTAEQQFMHAYKKSGVFEITISTTGGAEQNLYVTTPEAATNTILGISLGRQAVNSKAEPAATSSGGMAEGALAYLRMRTTDSTAVITLSDASLYPSSCVVIDGANPSLSNSYAIRKLYLANCYRAGSSVMSYNRGMVAAYLHDSYMVGSASAFAQDTKLELVYLHDSTSSGTGYAIGSKCFNGCSKMKTLVIDIDSTGWAADRLPTLSTSSFDASGMLNDDAKIYVNDAYVWTLKQATNWSTYQDKIYPLSEYEGERYYGED